MGLDFQSIAVGHVRDNKYLPSTVSNAQVEQLFTSTQVIAGNSGSPVLDISGNIIGIAGWVYNQKLKSGNIFIDVPIYSMAGGPNQFMLEKIVNKIITIQKDYNGPNGKPFIGLTSWEPVCGSALVKLRLQYPSFADSDNDNPDGIRILGLYNNGPLMKAGLKADDVILAISYGSTTYDIGVNDNEYSISRLVWINPIGTTLQLKYIRPSDQNPIPKTVNVTLEAYPQSLDYVFANAVCCPIPDA